MNGSLRINLRHYQSSSRMPRPIPRSARLALAATLLAAAPAAAAELPQPATAPATLPTPQPTVAPAPQPPSGWLGLRLATRDGKVVASAVLSAGPADRAGLAAGDTIVAINGQPVATSEAMIAIIRALPPASTVEVTLGGATPRTVKATLAERPKNDQEIFRKLVGSHFPSARAVGMDQQPVELPAAGQPTVLYFWATWCPSCSRTAPQLSALQQELGHDATIIALSPEDPLEVAAYAAKHTDLAYTIATDTDLASIPQIWVAAYPSWLVIDRSGTVVGAHIGAGEVGAVASELRDLVRQSAK
jgi:thiol-disulfide isomerase/thioredoxin